MAFPKLRIQSHAHRLQTQVFGEVGGAFPETVLVTTLRTREEQVVGNWKPRRTLGELSVKKVSFDVALHRSTCVKLLILFMKEMEYSVNQCDRPEKSLRFLVME